MSFIKNRILFIKVYKYMLVHLCNIEKTYRVKTSFVCFCWRMCLQFCMHIKWCAYCFYVRVCMCQIMHMFGDNSQTISTSECIPTHVQMHTHSKWENRVLTMCMHTCAHIRTNGASTLHMLYVYNYINNVLCHTEVKYVIISNQLY